MVYLKFSICLKNTCFHKKTQKIMKNHIEQAMTENTLLDIKPVSVKTIPVFKGFWSWLTGKPHHWVIEATFNTEAPEPKSVTLEQLSSHLREEPAYAWTVHCRVAMTLFDCEQEQGKHTTLVENEYKSAAVMERLFNVDITKHVNWKLKPQDPIAPTTTAPDVIPMDRKTLDVSSPVRQTVELIDHGKTGLLFREYRRSKHVGLEDYSDPTLNSEQPFKSTYSREFVNKLEAGDARWTEEFFQELIELTNTISKLKTTAAY